MCTPTTHKHGYALLVATLLSLVWVCAGPYLAQGAPAAPLLTRDSLVVTVGVRDYAALPFNAYALLDAHRIEAFARENIGIPPQHIVSVANPTNAALGELGSADGPIHQAVARFRPDAVVLYVNARSRLGDAEEQYFLGVDTPRAAEGHGVALSALVDALEALELPSLVIVDGGLITPSEATETVAADASPTPVSPPLPTVVPARGASQVALLRSYDASGVSYWDAQQQSSFFTSTFVESLRRSTGGEDMAGLVGRIQRQVADRSEQLYGVAQRVSAENIGSVVLADLTTTAHEPTATQPDELMGLSLDLGIAPVVTLASGATRGPEVTADVLPGTDTEDLAGLHTRVRTGDMLKLRFSVEAPASLYVFNVDASGRVHEVIPHQEVNEHRNPVSGLVVYPPAPDQFLEVVGAPGMESLVTVLAAKPLGDERHTLIQALEAVGSSDRQALEQTLSAFLNKHGSAATQRSETRLHRTFESLNGGLHEVIGLNRMLRGSRVLWHVESFEHIGRFAEGGPFGRGTQPATTHQPDHSTGDHDGDE